MNERKEKAFQHNEKVAERVKEFQQQLKERQEDIMSMLERPRTKDALDRKEKACQHNEKVAERVQNAQQQLQERQDGIKAKWEQKKGSRVKGELFSRVTPPPSPVGANTIDTTDVLLEDK